ncbi:MAG: nuclear transport factor 2 family protein [Hyphomicrobiaceae bacterium]
MNRRIIFACAAAVAAAWSTSAAPAVAETADLDAVKAANSAFYAALSKRDAAAMTALWANKPYVVNIGPRSKSIESGYADAVTKYWANAFNNVFLELKASMTSMAQVQSDGKLAWVVGTEHAEGKTKDGPFAFDTFATNVFEKDGDRWLLVSHQAGIQPK